MRSWEIVGAHGSSQRGGLRSIEAAEGAAERLSERTCAGAVVDAMLARLGADEQGKQLGPLCEGVTRGEVAKRGGNAVQGRRLRVREAWRRAHLILRVDDAVE